MGKIYFTPPLKEARFLRRLNRFAALLEDPLQGVRRAHIPNSGRLGELLYPGARVMITEKEAPGRKTGCDLTLVESGENGGWTCIDARLPGKILEAGWRDARRNTALDYWEISRREPAYGKGRFDLLLVKGAEKCLVETKSVTLVREETALFPDAPTSRGRRHMEDLAKACREGYRAAVFFIVQREDACCFAPYDEMDCFFGQVLRYAQREGVEIYSFLCRVDLKGVALDRPLPLKL